MGSWTAVTILHARVRGRLRVRARALYRNPEAARKLDNRLSDRDGISTVRVNQLTATVLIHFEPDLNAEHVLGMLAESLGLTENEAPALAQRGDRNRRHTAASSPPWRPFATSLSKLFSRSRTAHLAPTAPSSLVAASGNWHAIESPRVLDILTTSPWGLSREEAAARLRRYGLNQLEAAAPRRPVSILLGQFLTLPVGLLIVSAGISAVTAGVADALTITMVVVLNAAIGYFTERQADRTIQGLGTIVSRHAQVLRGGQERGLDATLVVPGDILRLSPGSYVAADMRLLEARHLTLDESALTGESLPVEKEACLALPPELPLAERRNLAFMGTMVTGGSGRGVVVATAQATELGRIQALAEGVSPPDTPMQQQLGALGTQLGLVSAAVCGGVFGIGLLRGIRASEMLTSAVSLAVAAVPEGLPAVATTTLALGINRMRRQRVAIRRLEAVETLGSVQILCLDKTGTLTFNRMSVASLVVGLHALELSAGGIRDAAGVRSVSDIEGLQQLLEVVALCNEAGTDASGQLTGSPTEQALLELARSCGADPQRLRRDYDLLEMHQRSEGRPLLSTLHRLNGSRRLVAVKGSPGELLQRCKWLLSTDRALEATDRNAILTANEQLASRAQRVLGAAFKVIADGEPFESSDLVWLGLVGMTDPLRPAMDQLIALYHRAGIKTVMITGDQCATAQAVGEHLALAGNRPIKILDAGRLERVDPALLAGLVHDVDVFARVSPAHKLRIVQAYQHGGRIVAMTGDGINDGPALKAANIGIAMGAGGSEVARSVADVVLEDDDLRTMAVAVRQGRTIYDNIRKSVHFLLATNFSEIEVMVAGIVLGTGPPLTPMQLLWLNLLSDVFPGLALSLETDESNVMERPPREAAQKIVSGRDMARMVGESLILAAGSLASLGYGVWRYGPGPPASALAFQTLILTQLLHAISCRSPEPVLWGKNRPPGNPYLKLALGGSLLLQVLTILVPGLRRILGTAIPQASDYAVIAVDACAPLLVNEALKSARGTRVAMTESPR
jgi:Ca2+-transporting ATPase